MTLLIGYGNPGRGDDGLGPAFADRIAGRGLPGLRVVSDFQLQVEHAALMARSRRTVFADAWMHASVPFRLSRVEPARDGDLTSHGLTPPVLLTLTRTLYGVTPEAFILAIGGNAFGIMHDELSPVANRNLEGAVDHFLAWFRDAGTGSPPNGKVEV